MAIININLSVQEKISILTDISVNIEQEYLIKCMRHMNKYLTSAEYEIIDIAQQAAAHPESDIMWAHLKALMYKYNNKFICYKESGCVCVDCASYPYHRIYSTPIDNSRINPYNY